MVQRDALLTAIEELKEDQRELKRDQRDLRDRLEEVRLKLAAISVKVGVFAVFGSILGAAFATTIVQQFHVG